MKRYKKKKAEGNLFVSGSCSSKGTSKVEFLSWMETSCLSALLYETWPFDYNILLISMNACPLKHGSIGLPLPAAEEEVDLCNFLALNLFELA